MWKNNSSRVAPCAGRKKVVSAPCKMSAAKLALLEGSGSEAKLNSWFAVSEVAELDCVALK